jgi:hypothetical protein
MATITTYVLVSGPEDLASVPEHELFSAYAFEQRGTQEGGEEQLPAATFALEQPLDDAEELVGVVRAFSADVPTASVVLCEVEERFDQVERLQLHVFRDWKRGGAVEHGYVFNVGPG